jgi:ribosomal-protein-serine acetyltransferase
VSPLPLDLGGGAQLRRYVPSDLEALWGAVQEERERLGVWMPWVDATRTIEDQGAWLDRVIADEVGLDGTGLWVGDEYAGGVGMTFGPFGVQAEIGYWIRSKFEGRGLITRGVIGMTNLAFRERGVHRVVIRAGVDNVRSRAIPERLGFTMEGVARGGERGSGGFYDLAVFAVLEDEWDGERGVGARG